MRELALALGREHRELELSFVTTRELPVPAGLFEALSPYGRILHADYQALSAPAIYHIPSPFEPSATDVLWPPERRDDLLVVTLHDLIPAVFPAEQMPDPGVRRAYWARAELVRQADRVLAVSEATAQDAVRLLGVPESKISVIGGGVSDGFRPPDSRPTAQTALGELQPEIDGEFILYTGGMDYRKNVGGLLQAYAGLPPALRERYMLVLVGRLGVDDPRGPFGDQAEASGIADRVVFTGFVSDEELVALYQACSLFVFPSLYEGFGLPVVEALACGAPALAGRNSSLVELVDREEAFFDAADPASIQEALERALGDAELLDRLRAPEIRERFTWRRIAGLTAAAYEELAPSPRRRRSRAKRVLSVGLANAETTLPVLEALAAKCEVDVLVADQEARQGLPEALQRISVNGLRRAELLRGGYDETIYWLGASVDDAFPLALLRVRPGIVVAYDVRLGEVYAKAAAERPELEPRRFRDLLREMYPGYRPNGSETTADNLERQGIYMVGEAIRSSTRFFVHDPIDESIARLEAKPGDEGKIETLGPESQPREDVAERLYSAITEPRLRSRR